MTSLNKDLRVDLDLSIEDYHSDKKIISSTGWKRAKRSTADFKAYTEEAQERKKHFDLGNAFELYLLDRESFNRDVVDETEILSELSEYNGPRNTKKYKDWKANQDGKYIISPEDLESIKKMTSNCMAIPLVKKFVEEGLLQPSFFYRDEESGLLCKSRPDTVLVDKSAIFDIKTTKDGSPEAFARDAANLEYPIQALMQIDGAEATKTIPEVKRYFWLAVEKSAPFNAQLYEFKVEDWDFVRQRFDNTMERLRNAFESDEFKGYSERSESVLGSLELNLPGWYSTDN